MIPSTRALLILLTAIPLTLDAAESIELANPTGGWRAGVADPDHYLQEVHYPANSVSAPLDQGKESLIRGQIKNSPKQSRKPYTLVVNGIAMPQRIEEDGSFSRPYSFAAGSNSVELRSPDGKANKRVQFYDTQSGQVRPKLRILLSWDTDNTDLDLHVVTPDGEHVFYGNRVLDNGGALDVDVTTGYGPEIFASAAPQPGTYLVYVNYYGSGEGESSLTTAQVNVVTDEGEANEQQQSFRIPLRQAGELTLVSHFVLP
jgi:uncharacterized protein YfaP (DUF2135 family)